MKYYVTDNDADCNTIIDRINADCGYPNKKVETYAEIMYHPTEMKCCIPIMDKAEKLLTSDEKLKLITDLPKDWTIVDL